MTEYWNGVPVRRQYLRVGTRRWGHKLETYNHKPRFLVAHDTGNIDTTAQANVSYYNNTYNIDWDYVASAHFFVDDKECIICIPLDEQAWHVMLNAPVDNAWYVGDADRIAVGGEACYFSDKKRTKKSLDNFARVMAYLCDIYNIDYKTEMPGHQDIQSDKQDPGNILAQAGYSRSTSNLDKLVGKYIGIKSTKKPTETKKKESNKVTNKKAKAGQITPKIKHTNPKIAWNWAGTFYPNTTIKVRKTPSLKGAVVDTNSWLFNKNDWVKFNRVIKKDGFWWIRFKYQAPGSSKDYFYCAVCKITDKSERIKKEKYWGKIDWK